MLRIGVQGEEAMGKEVQLFVHNLNPFVQDKGAHGWDQQLQTNPIIQFNCQPSWIFQQRHFALRTGGDFGLGTLENYVGGSVNLMIGYLGQEVFFTQSDNNQVLFESRSSGKVLFYNSLISGTPFGNDPKGVSNEDLNAFTFNQYLGVKAQWKWIQTGLGINFEKTQFKELPWHKYTSVSLGILL